MRLFKSLALGLALAGGGAADADVDKSEATVELDLSTFSNFIQKNGVVMVDYYAPWCGHCVKFAPKYESAAKQLRDWKVQVKLAKVDCTRQTRLCADHGIRAYPTMKIFKAGSELYHDYEGPRRVSAIVDFMIKQVLPTVSTLTDKEQVTNFLQNERAEVVLMGYFANANDATHINALNAAAEKLHEDFPVGLTYDADSVHAAGVTVPALVLYKPDDEGKIVYEGKWDTEAIKEFTKHAYEPLVGELGSESWRHYTSGEQGPTLFIFHTNDWERKRLKSDVRSIAKKHEGKLQIAMAEIPDFAGFANYLHLETEPADLVFPAVAIYDGTQKKKYPFDNSIEKGVYWRGAERDPNEKNIDEFVTKFLLGRLQPTVKSEDEPTKHDGPVTTVVAKTYDKIVLDSNKDVLLYFHRPDCPFCVAMNPVYDTLGSMYTAADRASKVTIAKINILKNDINEEIPYVPFVKLFKAGDKTSVTYSGDRSVNDLVGFIKQQGTHAVDALHEHAVSSSDAAHGDAATGGAQQPLEMDKLHEQPLQGRTHVRPLHDEL